MKILVICGPTATGKTALALSIANQLGGELISCDARQIYQDLDIGTGKEVELLRSGQAQKQAESWIINGIPIYGYDLISAKDQYDASSFALFARQKITHIQDKGRLPILVGGTGLYSKITLQGLGTYGIGQDSALRQELEMLSPEELTNRLADLDAKRLAGLNQSDRKNPRRLIRQIEIATHQKNQATNHPAHDLHQPLTADVLKIGLTMPKAILDETIERRVRSMFGLGLEDEVRQLVAQGYTFNDPGLQTIGYSEFAAYFSNQESIKDVESAVILHTTQYAKRQMTYFKPDQDIQWFNVENSSARDQAFGKVISWFHNQQP